MSVTGNSRHLKSQPVGSLAQNRYDGASSAGQTRPPLLSVPSTQSVQSMKSLSNLIDSSGGSYLGRNIGEINGDDLNSMILRMHAQQDEVGFDRYAYWAYYIPILKWFPNYNYRENFLGDMLAGMSLASFQIPLVMSFSTSLAHLSPLAGLYSIVASSSLYAIFGCVPVLVVGPSPSTALILGSTIESIIHDKRFEDVTNSEVAATLAAGIGGILLAAGIFRLGFIDNVLSRSLLKGFIAAMGLIIIISELATQMGLTKLANTEPHHTTVEKFAFIAKHYHETHKMTFWISLITLIVVFAVRKIKLSMVNKMKKKSAIYIPELLAMIIIATYLSWYYDWESKGVDIVGKISAGSVRLVNPLSPRAFRLVKKVFSASFLCVVLGYFDSTTANKALGARFNYNVSSNRELIALGALNSAVSSFGGLPSFGALGRSKISISSGATSPMAGIFVALSIVVSIFFLIPTLYYLPECVLSLSTTIVGITVLEEAPSDLSFLWRIGGYDEIFTFIFVLLITLLWSTEAGVVMGVSVAIIRVVKHSSKSRIQILGRIPNTNSFRNADEIIEECFPSNVESESEEVSSQDYRNFLSKIEEIEGTTIIRIPEPLNFANIGDLKNKLSRIEKYGSLLVHPSQPYKRTLGNGAIDFIIFDCHGLDDIDSSATQILHEIIERYIRQENVTVFFSRVSTNYKVRKILKKSGIVALINESYNKYFSFEPTNHDQRFIPVSSSGLGGGFYLSIEDALKSIDPNYI